MAIQSSVSFYPCSSIQATHHFYSEILGLSLHSDQGKARIYDTGYGYWGFVEYGDRQPNPAGLCLSLNCEDPADVDRHYDQLVAKGVHPLAPPHKHPQFPVYSFFLKDPDGYLVEFQKILDA